MKILIADDNVQITNILKMYVEKEGYQALVVYDGMEVLKVYQQADLILLDVMMPKLDGFSVVKEIRKTSSIPIIMVTAKGEDYEKIMGLDIGADDYIVKPFSPNEVVARIKAILRRIEKSETQVLVYENLRIDMSSYTVSIDDTSILLTKKELELLYTLAANPNKAFSRDALLNSVWGYSYYGDSRTVDSHMTRLRSKLEVVAHPSWDIKTVWGVGYKIEKSTL
ncbi:MAG: response regulator transcription factor [Erysipelotrichaceae bacterium]